MADVKGNVLFRDYCSMLTPSAFVDEREALSRLEWERR
jgi:hypothetical protein